MAADATTVEVAVPAPDGDLSRSKRRGLLTALAITQTVGYGVLYYAFSVFLIPVALTLHTNATVVTGALTTGVILTGLAAIPVGRWIDRHGAHGLMTTGSVLSGAAVAAWSQVHTVTELYAVFAIIGIASAMVLYEPAFAVIINHVTPARRAGALLAVTIVAGFASSIFLPAAGLLNAHLGWRHAILTLAAIHVAITVPLHATAIPRGRRSPLTSTHPQARAASGIRDAVGDRDFWLMLLAFTAQGAAVAVVSVHLVAYLTTLGHRPAFAATVAGLLGIFSVTGRLVTTGLHRRHSIARITAGVFVLQAIAIAILPLVGTSTVGAISCVTVFGLGFGVATIARPAMLAGRYGTTAYAAISGNMSAPMNAAKAIAPLGAAAIAATAAGYTTVIATVAVACAIAAATLLAASAAASQLSRTRDRTGPGHR